MLVQYSQHLHILEVEEVSFVTAQFYNSIMVKEFDF